jgi:hypothetical protein
MCGRIVCGRPFNSHFIRYEASDSRTASFVGSFAGGGAGKLSGVGPLPEFSICVAFIYVLSQVVLELLVINILNVTKKYPYLIDARCNLQVLSGINWWTVGIRTPLLGLRIQRPADRRTRHTKNWCSTRDSNSELNLRKVLLYPVSLIEHYCF